LALTSSPHFFAEGEFWFSLVKVVTIIAFIILGGAAIFGFIPMQDGSPAPGLQHHRRRLVPPRWIADSDDHGGGEFRFSGTELIGIAAGETQNPHQVIPVAIRTTIARLIIFFIGTVFVLAALIPMQQAGVEKARLCWCSKRWGSPMRRIFLTL
jgi:S-methylmethionine transporter